MSNRTFKQLDKLKSGEIQQELGSDNDISRIPTKNHYKNSVLDKITIENGNVRVKGGKKLISYNKLKQQINVM